LDGRLGGAIYAQCPDGRPAVVTRFLSSLAEATGTVEVLAYVRDRGLPVARHDLVVDLDDGVAFVQERRRASQERSSDVSCPGRAGITMSPARSGKPATDQDGDTSRCLPTSDAA
jgi:hypothetical protein